MRVKGRICWYFCNESEIADFFSFWAAPTFFLPVAVLVLPSDATLDFRRLDAPPRISRIDSMFLLISGLPMNALWATPPDMLADAA